MPKTTRSLLNKIIITQRSDGLWDCTRMRASSGEAMVGAKSLEEVFQFIRAHDEKIKGDRGLEIKESD